MPHPTVVTTVLQPGSGMHVALDPRTDYAPDDPLVTTYPWAFAELDRTPVETVALEQTSAAPGKKRTRRRSR